MDRDTDYECPTCGHSYPEGYYPIGSRPGLDACTDCVDRRDPGPEPVRLFRLNDHGCFVGLKHGRLLSCPMLTNGQPEIEDGQPNLGTVTHPEPAFLEAVNATLGTRFQLDQFHGL